LPDFLVKNPQVRFKIQTYFIFFFKYPHTTWFTVNESGRPISWNVYHEWYALVIDHNSWKRNSQRHRLLPIYLWRCGNQTIRLRLWLV
jgi:hypothetical protein